MAGDSDSQIKCDASFTEEIENVTIPSFTSSEEKALVRKVDLTLLPTIWIMYLLSYMDRTKYVFCHSCYCAIDIICSLIGGH